VDLINLEQNKQDDIQYILCLLFRIHINVIYAFEFAKRFKAGFFENCACANDRATRGKKKSPVDISMNNIFVLHTNLNILYCTHICHLWG